MTNVTNEFLGLLELTLTRTHGLLYSLESTGVGLSVLTATWKSLSVSAASVGINVFKTLNVCGNGTLQLTLDREALYFFADRVFLIRRDVSRLCELSNVEFGQDGLGAGATDTMNCGQTEFKVFIVGNCNTCYTHISILMLVFFVLFSPGAACGAA